MRHFTGDTITAIATSPGKGGVGIIRLSGPNALSILESISTLTVEKIKPRFMHYCSFKNEKGSILDQGLCLYFPAPNSFTGEEIVELHGHGGPVVLGILLQEVIRLGARQARPGEFSERAFLNDKMDLTQAEAIADLIESSTEQAARNAVRSLQGKFSEKINHLLEMLIELRVFIEAAIDFPEEEVDFLENTKITETLDSLIKQTENSIQEANKGRLIQDGINLVIVGKPNVGKSSLLNALTGHTSAIVTDIAGTTRDVIRESINIDGLPVNILDTAGLNEKPDKVEKIGIRRAWEHTGLADWILFVTDSPLDIEKELKRFQEQLKAHDISEKKIVLIINKIDLTGEQAEQKNVSGIPAIALSAKQNVGIDLLQKYFKETIGYQENIESGISARVRHVDSLKEALTHIEAGKNQLILFRAGELLAEELRLAQKSLAQITGEFSSDDLLGKIFSSFCIGK